MAVWSHHACGVSVCLYRLKTSFLLKRNGPTDLNKMISKVYGCKMGQGE